MKRIGFLGLGIMGFGMSSNLIAKYRGEVVGFDPVIAQRNRFLERGGTVANSAQELYNVCDIIILSLPTNKIVADTVHGIIQTARPGTIIIDVGSSSPDMIRSLCAEARDAGIYLIDAPVSGGEDGAVKGTLTIMVGGDKQAFEEVLPILEMMGTTITYMGESGCGDLAKIANNMMVGIHLCAIGEAFAFAKKAGLEPDKLFHAIQNGVAQSFVMDHKVPLVLQRKFEPSARVAVHLKDINNAMGVAMSLGVEIPLSSIVKEQMDWMDREGLINEDHCAVVKYYEAQMGVEIC